MIETHTCEPGGRNITNTQILGGRYRIEATIGEGGMARLFRAYDSRLDRMVAIKVLREQFAGEPQFLERFLQEARLSVKLSHPNIVNVYDVDAEGGLHYIVMEYVEGENLRQLFARAAPLAVEASLPLIRQLGSALDYAHDHGVIHRDIKPENILVTDQGHLKVGDFGIARALAGAGFTATGTVLGSVAYFSPEQAEGKPAIRESDLYSMGMVLYEMLTRQVPFAGTNPVAVAMAQVNDPPPPPRSFKPDLPPAVDAVVLKAIAKDPQARYHRGADLAAALQAAIAPRSVRRQAPAAFAPAFAPTLANAVAPQAVAPKRPGQSNAGALAALFTTAGLLIAAVLIARGLTGGDRSSADAGATASPSATAGTQPAGAAQPTATTTASPTPSTAATATGPAGTGPAPAATATATAGSVITPAFDTQTVVPTPSDTAAAPAAPSPTPSTGSLGDTTLQLVTATGVGDQFSPVGVTTDFPASSRVVYAFATVHHKPKGAGISFVWHYPDGSSFAFNNRVIAPYTDTIAYAELFPRNAGAYSVSASIRGHELATVHFTIGSAIGGSAPGTPPAAVQTNPDNSTASSSATGPGKGHRYGKLKKQTGNGSGDGSGD